MKAGFYKQTCIQMNESCTRLSACQIRSGANHVPANDNIKRYTQHSDPPIPFLSYHHRDLIHHGRLPCFEET